MGVLRYISPIIPITSSGTTIAHGLPGTPTEFHFSPTIAPGASGAYFLGVSSTNVVLAVAIGGVTGVVDCSIPHTWIQ